MTPEFEEFLKKNRVSECQARYSSFIHGFDDDLTGTVFLYFDRLEIIGLEEQNDYSLRGETAVILNRDDFNKFYEQMTEIKRLIDDSSGSD